MLLNELSSARTLDPFREMERLRREFDRVLGAGRAAAMLEFPSVNVWSSENEAHVTAEIPGMSPSDIEISVGNETLTLRGSRKPEELKEGERYHRRERGFGQFTRAVELPFRIDAEKVQARFSKGVLTVSLPRSDQDKPRKIAVQAE